LPNWVVAQLLARRPGGTIYLIATEGVRETRLRLTKALEANWKIEFTETSESDAAKIFSAVEGLLKAGKANVSGIGLNYTGGTKMMAVHAHRAFQEACKDSQPLMSYLDARSLELKFDHLPPEKSLKLAEVSQYPQLQISLETLFGLHDEHRSLTYQQTAIAIPAARGLVAMHGHLAGQEVWRKWSDNPLIVYGYNNLKKTVGGINLDKLDKRDRQQIISQLDRKPLPTLSDWENSLKSRREIKKLVPAQQAIVTNQLVDGYRQFLQGLNAADVDTLKDAAQKSSEFADSLLLAKWLDGLWLEHYTFDQLQGGQAQNQINPNGLALNVESVNAQGRKFEADVIALRGYQLFYCSCYTGSDPATSKRKLFEAMIRAEQLGGEEAKVALICCSDQPETVEREAESDFQRKGTIRVFGRRHLPNLAIEMTKWLTGK
jgi:hypothetical protein